MSDTIYLPLTEEEFRKAPSETARYRHLTAPYCTGCGVDIASQGHPVHSTAMQFDLPEREFLKYSNGRPPASPIPLRGYADKLPFTNGSLDFVYASHILEDYADYNPVLNEWIRCLKSGGRLVILVPDRERWNYAIQFRNQPPNCQHKREPSPGDLTKWLVPKGMKIIKDELTNLWEHDYSIICVSSRI